MAKGIETSKGKKYRLQFDASPWALKEYRQWQSLCGLPTMVVFIINALTMFVWAIKEVIKGHQICSYDEKRDSYMFCEMPAFLNARQHAENNSGASSLIEGG